MANRLSKEKANLIASNYMTNGLKKVQALLDAGYSTSYANCKRGLSLYDNVMVKEAISKIQARNTASTEMTVEKVQDMYKDAYDMAVTTRQASSMVSAVTGIARLYGMDKDASLDKQEAEAITPEELELLKKQAKAITKPNIKLNAG